MNAHYVWHWRKHFDFASVVSQSLECSWGYREFLCKTHQKSGWLTGHTDVCEESKDQKAFFGGNDLFTDLTLFSSFVHCSMHSPPKQNNPVAVCRGRRIEEWEIHISPCTACIQYVYCAVRGEQSRLDILRVRYRMRQSYLYSYSLQIIYIACVCMSPLCAWEFAHRVIIVNIAATKAQLLSWICVYGHFVKRCGNFLKLVFLTVQNWLLLHKVGLISCI